MPLFVTALPIWEISWSTRDEVWNSLLCERRSTIQPEGGFLTKMAPSLVKIVGALPLPEARGLGTGARFRTTFVRRFVACVCVCSFEEPLILFLDGLRMLWVHACVSQKRFT
jgi:hypothetical protein